MSDDSKIKKTTFVPLIKLSYNARIVGHAARRKGDKKMKLTPKENYLMLGRGEMPEYVPFYTMMGTEFKGEAPVKTLSPRVFPQNHFQDGGYDMWGVRYKADENTGATLPEPNNFMLEDIADWEKVIKFPEMPDFDYEMMYKKDLAASGIDRNQSATIAMCGLMPFQQIVAFMGFVEGLMALASDPDSVKDCLNAMVDFIEPVMYKTIEYYKPDIWYLVDDTATKHTPFFSLDTYRDIFVPIYRRLAKPAVDRGIPVQFHNCGKCEIFVEDMIDFGVKYWDPAQEMNDLLAIKEKYKGKICLVGCWDWDEKMPKNWPNNFDEEYIRQGVRDSIDKYGKDGGYSFSGGIPGKDEFSMRANKIVREEAHYYGHRFYGDKYED